MAHFEIKHLTFSYPTSERDSLKDICLKVEQGQYLTLCGKSGSGKTTLMRHFKSALTPHGTRSGEVYFDDTPLSAVSLREQSTQIGYVLQNPDDQLVTDKVWHELAFGLESLGCDQSTMRLRVAEMASYFGIDSWFHKNVAELSGGQKQLLNLASVMAMQPSILILDEPTAQLDPIAATDFLNTVRKINLELGTTIIISEHRLEEVFPCADRVVVMEGGEIFADDTPRNIGAKLYREQNDLFASLPAPMQIFYGTQSTLPCPLTVREGRGWLTQCFPTEKPAVTHLTEPRRTDGAVDTAVELREVWFRYERESPDVLKGVSLKIPRGTLFAIVGGNGTGKSTTLKTVCGICKPYRGKVLIDGESVGKHKNLFQNCLAMLPQDPQSLFVKKTVQEDLSEMLSGSVAENCRKLKEISEICEISELWNAHPYDLSGGEQQRVALGKVLLCSPRILLLDEPTKGLDNFFKQKLAGVLTRLTAMGTTVILVSHDIEFCAQYADSVSLFFDGNIVTTNTPECFFSQNSFYTTAANRMSRHIFQNAITNREVIALCNANGI